MMSIEAGRETSVLKITSDNFCKGMLGLRALRYQEERSRDLLVLVPSSESLRCS